MDTARMMEHASAMSVDAEEKPLEGTLSKPTRKRRRVVISCTACHRRKQKCNRETPCSNCISRHKEDSCSYESPALAAKRQALAIDNDGVISGKSCLITDEEKENSHQSRIAPELSSGQLSVLGYSNTNGHNNIVDILKRIENHERDGPTSGAEVQGHFQDTASLRERYKVHIRHLPAKPFIDTLVATFFREVNWTYSYLDESTFEEQLDRWNSLPFSIINEAPYKLPPDLRFFPHLLFQVLAMALLFQPQNYDPSLDSLKYAANMSLDDLANDYSESGSQLARLLHKRDTTLVAVQAGFMRTSFLKHCGDIPESWHSLGETIRDAQEINLQKDVPNLAGHDPEKAIEGLWQTQARRRLWMTLSCWDSHMSVVLGRPAALIHDKVGVLPIDAPIPADRKTTVPIARSEGDPPTSLTMLLVINKTAAALREMIELQNDGPCPKNYSKVEVLHRKIVQEYERVPAYFRCENPDTTYDTLPECSWLPSSRHLLDSYYGMTLLSLHRPYTFTVPKSRRDGLQAALHILRAQRRYFQFLQAHQYKMFNLVFSTFDAVVLVAALFIVYPTENQEFLEDALQHFGWAMQRFETMSERNQIAKSALSVLQATHVRLMRVLDQKSISPKSSASQSTQATVSESPASSVSQTESDLPQKIIPKQEEQQQQPRHKSMQSIPDAPATIFRKHASSNVSAYSSDNISPAPLYSTNASSSTAQAQQSLYPDPVSAAGGPDWVYGNSNALLPTYDNSQFNFATMAPLQPMHDLLYNDLVGMSDGSMHAQHAQQVAADMQTFYAAQTNTPWQFEGEFRDDSFWNYMNNQ